MSQTLSQLVQRTVTRLSMVAGIGVQVYAEDRIAEMIWHKFVMVKDELWWDDYMEYATLTQDGNGRPVENVLREKPPIPTVDAIVINSFNDVQFAWSPRLRDPLKDMPKRANPSGFFTQGNTLYKLADASKVIRFAPYTPGMQMLVRYARHVEYFQPDDIVPMDDQLMILGACYDYLEDDGTNSGQAEKFRNMFNDRLRQLKNDENERSIPLSPTPYNNGNWTVV